MGITNAQKRKQAKKKARDRRIRRAANVRHNQKPDRYRLDVLVDGEWAVGVMRFKDPEKVMKYVETTEARRKAGEEIAPGKVVDGETGKTVVEIPGSKPKQKGELPDAISDGPKADPNVIGVQGPVPEKELTEEPDSR